MAEAFLSGAVVDAAAVGSPVVSGIAAGGAWKAGGVVAPALLLAACGGGGGGGGAAVTAGTTVPVAVVTPVAAATPVAGSTPVATVTPVPAATPTPVPVTTPTPVATPTTATPAPTPTPTPAPTPSQTSPSSPVEVHEAPITASDASRFLAQATMGATRTSIDALAQQGYAGWIDAQLTMPRATSYWDWLMAGGYNVTANINLTTGFDAMVWSQLITAPDQLRQRVTTALLDILVVSIDGIGSINWKQFAVGAYLDILADNAFGNYRTLLGKVTTNAVMGAFLSYSYNRKANPVTGAQPDENYARELMQLFTIGLHRLNMDGTPMLSNGEPVETFTQSDVSQLARVFTGLQHVTNVNTFPDRYRTPLIMRASDNEPGPSTFLGSTVSGGDGMAKIGQALDVIFMHPNVPPFVSRQLIQRLITSNPSPAYVARIATIFADDGAGVRGNLAAVIRAILLDPEARGTDALANPAAGKLRDPVQRLTGWARAFGVTSPSNAWAIGDTSNASTRLGQSIGHAPSVFNFFRPGYAPPATLMSSQSMVAPEFQITNEQSVVGYVNFMYGLVASGIGDVRADYSAIVALAGDPAALVAEINLVLAAGQLSTATVAAIVAAVGSVAAGASDGPINRVGIAIVLTLASPDYLTLR